MVYMTKTKSPEIRVFFDSNALYTKVASDLFNAAIAELIKSESNRSDVHVSWHVSDVVIKERQYQMQKFANELFPSIEKLEKLLGHNLGITSDILEKRIENCILEQTKKYKLQVLGLDLSNVDLSQIIHRSCYRLAPFSAGENEKGFRDAIIAEIFFQFVKVSPKSSLNCKIIFLTQDGDLKKHIEVEMKDKKNVIVLSKVDELIGLINTLASEVDEDTIKKYQELAEIFFFDSKNKTGFFYKEKIKEVVSQQYKSELLLCPTGGRFERKNLTWYVSRPQFVKKNRMCVNWSTRIEVTCEIFKEEIVQSSSLFQSDANFSMLNNLLPESSINYNDVFKSNAPMPGGGLLSALMPKKTLVSKGKTLFEIRWSVNIGQNKKLTRAKIDEINYTDTVWEDV